MPLSPMWTLAPAAAPGDERPLAEWGVAGATLEFRSLAPDTLRLTVAGATALDAPELWAWETPLILRRDGQPFYRGRVASIPRSGTTPAESASYEVRSVWWDLERLTYMQTWTAANGSFGTGRAYLGGPTQTTAAALLAAAAYASAKDVPVDLDLSAMTGRLIPALSEHNRTVAQLLIEIMRWHPESVLVQDHSASTPTLRAIPRPSAAAALLEVGSPPLADLEIAPRPDLVPDSVHVLYETSAPQAELAPGYDPTDNPGAYTLRRRLVVGRDVWPLDAATTRRSLVVTLPGPDLPELETEAEAPPEMFPSPPLPHVQPVRTAPLPPSGATDTKAQQWWLDKTGLAAEGITVGDIRLPSISTEDIHAHTVVFADETDAGEMPSPINPNSTPLYKPPSPTDLPRELLDGSLSEWMGVKWAPLICRVTIGVRASTVDELPAEARARIERMAPRRGEVQGVPAYLIDAEARVTGTTAKTRNYKRWPSTSQPGGQPPTSPNPPLAADAAQRAVIPGLARAMYESRAELHYEGRAELVAGEAGGTRYLGSVLSIAGGRPEWAAARALIQSESLDLGTGRTTLAFGPPEHLSEQDWVALHEAARASQLSRALAADAAKNPATGDIDPAPPPPPTPPPPESDAEDIGTGGAVFGGTTFPRSSFAVIGGGAERKELWDLERVPGTGALVRIVRPGRVSKGHIYDAASGLSISGVGATHSVAAGDMLYLALLPNLDLSLERGSTWPGWPYATEGEIADFSLPRMVAYRYPLWQFVGADPGGGGIPLGEGLWARRMAPPTNLHCEAYVLEAEGGHMVSTWVLKPGPGTIDE